jgi:hypothetical protein
VCLVINFTQVVYLSWFIAGVTLFSSPVDQRVLSKWKCRPRVAKSHALRSWPSRGVLTAVVYCIRSKWCLFFQGYYASSVSDILKLTHLRLEWFLNLYTRKEWSSCSWEVTSLHFFPDANLWMNVPDTKRMVSKSAIETISFCKLACVLYQTSSNMDLNKLGSM